MIFQGNTGEEEIMIQLRNCLIKVDVFKNIMFPVT